MIFVSHNWRDKPVVEEIAKRLGDTFGQDQVFYDSWSIQPGDGIVGKMNDGLEACRLFLFFVSENSLKSKMVELEWQNAIIKASKGTARFVPIRLDGSAMPALLAQTLYIDLFTHGLEAALRQIVDVATGANTFRPGQAEFSNLEAYAYPEGRVMMLEIHARHYMEPISHFLVAIENAEGETTIGLPGAGSFTFGFHRDITFGKGTPFNAWSFDRGKAIVPGFPLRMKVSPEGSAEVKLLGLLHEKSENFWSSVPLARQKPRD